jgi:glycosyltransferase involved in cell wall biosynthesis
VTILINNYNYGRFLRDAIDSALNQTYRDIEVIVVDDGSTDNSREIIASYGDRIISILKENGGQASAFNAGFSASRGDIICLLDSDDLFYPDKVERVIRYSQPGSLLYHRLQVQPGANIIPIGTSPGINFYRYAQRYGFIPYVGSPTSGIALRRDLAIRLMPLPTQNVRSSADDFVVRAAALLGHVIGIPDLLGTYRVHGDNAWHGKHGRKSHEFMGDLENYLNLKLLEAGKSPVVDFYRSIYARDFIPQTATDLARLALSVFTRHADFVTMRFMMKTLARAGRCAILPSKRHPVDEIWTCKN